MLLCLFFKLGGRLLSFTVLLFLLPYSLFAPKEESTWVRLAMIQVESRALADSILKRLQAGESFFYLATMFSEDLNTSDGGEMGWERVIRLPREIQVVVRKLGINSLSSILAYKDKFWIIKKLDEGKHYDYKKWKAAMSKAKSLNKKFRQNCKARKYSKAISLAYQALNLRDQNLEPNHPSIAFNLYNLALLYDVQGNDSTAKLLYLRAFQIWKEVYGQDYLYAVERLSELFWSTYVKENYTVIELGSHDPTLRWWMYVPDDLYQQVLEDPIGTAINSSLDLLYNTLNNDAATEKLRLHALKNYEQMYGADGYKLVPSLMNLARFYRVRGKYPNAESFYLRALKIAEKRAPRQPVVALILDDLAGLYRDQGNYTAAEPLYQRSLKIREKVIEQERPNIAMSLNNLAKIHHLQGNFAMAEPLYLRAMKLSESALGQNHPDVAKCLNNLGLLYHDRGDYVKAEPLHQRALKIKKQVHGPDHPEIATGLSNLAELYREQGNYAKAEVLCQRALKISEQTSGPDSLDVAATLNNLALIHYARGNLAAAEPLYQRALRIREKTLGQEHPDVATSLNNFAGLYLSQGNYAAAESLYQGALKIREKSTGSKHPVIAASLNNLAWIQYSLGKYTEAKQLYVRMLDIWEQVLGLNHPNAAKALYNFGLVEMALNQPEFAKQYFQRAANTETAIMQDLLIYSTEFEKLAFVRMIARGLDKFITLATHDQYTDSLTVNAAFDLMLQRKALTLDASSWQQQVYLTSTDSVTVRLFERFQTLSQQIAQLTFAGPRDTALIAYRQKLATLLVEREHIEDILGQRSGAFLHEQQTRQADARRVLATLSAGNTFIEIVRYYEIDFHAKDGMQMVGAARYAVFSLTAKGTGNLQIYDLGPAQPIDSLILAYRQEMKNALNLGLQQQKESERRLAVITNRLYRIIFTPIRDILPDSGTLYCAPDGLLHLLPFEILVDDSGKYLLERYQFNYLGSGRDLLRFAKVSKTGAMYVFAGANFDGKPTTAAISKEPLLAVSELISPSEHLQKSRDWRGGKFNPLDGTSAEAQAIQNSFELDEGQVFLDLRATEEKLLSLQAPWRLHIATHGFFLKDQEEIRQLTGQERFLHTFGEQRLGLGQFENPLLRSGLALAGANTIGQKQDSTQTYDGIATAYEISGMNLQGTDLVVLSACETGLGEVQNGEGVFGLRRAFQLAGAQTVVMSLWKVPDNETKELMIDFYTRLKNGEGKSQALRNAELAMMRKQREQYGSAHPYFWGAFICAGNPE